MKILTIIVGALALAVPATAYAAADCCKGMECCTGMECCKDGADCCTDGKGDCCKDMKMGGDHAGHDMPAAPAK